MDAARLCHARRMPQESHHACCSIKSWYCLGSCWLPVVVFLVALPLCMGIAIASGMPPSKGLITGIIGGLVEGWMAGSPLQVSGPGGGFGGIGV